MGQLKDGKIPLISLFIDYFKIFNRYSGKKMWFLCAIIFLGGLFEGFGLSLLLPILSVEHPDGEGSTYSKIIYQFYHWVGLPPTLTTTLGLLVVTFLLKGLFMFFQGFITARIMTQLTKVKRLEICKQYADMNYLYYTDNPIGFLNNIITTEVDRAVSAFGQYTELLVIAVYIVIYLVGSFLINWGITFLVLGLCALLFLFSEGLSRISRQLSFRVSEKNAQVQSLLIQMIYNFKYLKATNRFSALYEQFAKRVAEQQWFHLRNTTISSIPGCMLEPLAILFLAALTFYYVSYCGKSVNEVVVLLLFFYRCFTKVFGLQVAWQKFCSRAGGVDVLEETMPELQRHREPHGDAVPADVPHQIILRDVVYRYGSRPILSGISMNISANKTIAIVGESGAGKTTILDMLAGLITPEQGQILLDGKDYSEINLSLLRSKIGYVTQEAVIFNDTIANNISFWAEDYSPEELQRRIESAATLAHCVEFIGNTEKKYASVIGDKGVKLSVGQRQRVAIARELFKEPAIMIFDEATSALDSESERLIQESINAIMGTRTMIIVAHRLSTIRKCDYIYVLGQGKIIEEGRFDHLYADHESRFARMCEAQKL